MNPNELLPIKVVFPRPEDYKAPPPARGSTKIFGVVDETVRRVFANEVRQVERYFDASFQAEKEVPAVAKVTLKPEAVAKNHRPTELFGLDTCPIIGGNKLGELYVSVEPRGLDRLAKKIEQGESKQIEANISTLSQITPYTALDVLGGASPADIEEKILRQRLPLRVRLFRYQSPFQNARLDAYFERVAREHGVEDLQALDYAEGLRVYRARTVAPRALAALANIVGIQSLSLFPAYRVVRTTARALGNVSSVD